MKQDMEESVLEAKRNAPFWRRWAIAPHVSSFTMSYTLHCIAGADAIWPHGFEPDWAKEAAKGIAFVGAAIGMVIGGFAGDWFGRRKALLLALATVALGSIIQAVACGSQNTLFTIIVIGRLIAGMGAGALYPVSACLSFEAGSKNPAAQVCVAFWFYIPGGAAQYFEALLFRWWFPGHIGVQWRLIFVMGAVYPMIVAFLAPRTAEMPKGTTGSIVTEFKAAVQVPGYWWTLLGTGGTWFLFDITNYGVSLALPAIEANMFSSTQSTTTKLWRLVLVKFAGPCVGGALAVVWVYMRWSLKGLMAWGFVSVGVAFSALAIVWDRAPDARAANLVILMLTQATLMWGCQFATYLYPQVAFPQEIRSTFHGLSAFAGKCGAVLGTYAFRPITHAFGTSASELHKGYITVMSVQVGIAAAGLILTWFLLQKPATVDSNATALPEDEEKGSYDDDN